MNDILDIIEKLKIENKSHDIHDINKIFDTLELSYGSKLKVDKKVCISFALHYVLGDVECCMESVYVDNIGSKNDVQMNQLGKLNKKLQEHGLWADYALSVLLKFTRKAIEEIADSFDEENQTIEGYRRKFHELNILDLIDEPSVKSYSEYLEDVYKECFFKRNVDRIHQEIVSVCPNELFLNNMKICLSKKSLLQDLSSYLKSNVYMNILNVGTSTKTLLIYCNDYMKNLNYLDPSGYLNRESCSIISDYILGRKDLIKTVVDLLSCNMSDELNFVKHRLNKLKEVTGKDETRIVHSPFDILKNFMCVYENAKEFMEQFKIYLADKLLRNITEDAFMKEAETVSVLMGCFGKELLSGCLVMMNDISKSLKNNNSVRLFGPLSGVKFENIVLTPSIWPSLPNVETYLTSQVETYMERAKKLYEIENPHRTIEWVSSQDIVEIEIKIKRKKRNFGCNPTQAHFIRQFNSGSSLTLREIQLSMYKTEQTEIEEIADFWIEKGVICKTHRKGYRFVEEFA